MGIYDPQTQFPAGSQSAYAVHGWLQNWSAQPIFMPVDPWYRPGDLTFIQPNAKLEMSQSVPIHKPGVQDWEGRWEFSEPSGLFIHCKRSMFQKGTKANIFAMAEFNYNSFDMTGATMAIELGNNPAYQLVGIVNGCYSGVAQNAAGAAYPKQRKIIAKDQIYGGNLCVKQGDTANYKPVNPCDPSVGTPWYNGHENFDVTNPQHYVAALENMQQRCAMNGVELNIGDEGLELWINFGRKERAKLILEVFQQLAQSGIVTPIVVSTGQNTTAVNSLLTSYNDTVIQGTQTNPVFGRMKVRAVTGLRPDLAVIVAPRPAPLPQYSAFIYMHGGAVGEFGIQDDPAALMNDKVPHIATFVWDQKSPMFFGVEGTTAGDIGVSNILTEGFASVSGLLFEYLFTGSAS
jgi:hypothetical protein